MDLGTGIFLSSLIFSLTALFIATRERWNWKKLFLWPMVILFSLSTLVTLGIYLYSNIPSNPEPEKGLWGIDLNATQADIKFLKGNPTEANEKYWVYKIEMEYREDSSVYSISFRSGRIYY